MSKKDFELIASTINKLVLRDATKFAVANAFAKELARTNQRFDVDRFLKACNVRQEIGEES